jgi:hypothetical protein
MVASIRSVSKHNLIDDARHTSTQAVNIQAYSIAGML